MNKKSEKEIQDIIDNVTATLSFEDLKVGKFTIETTKEMLRGEITGEEARKKILEKYNLDN